MTGKKRWRDFAMILRASSTDVLTENCRMPLRSILARTGTDMPMRRAAAKVSYGVVMMVQPWRSAEAITRLDTLAPQQMTRQPASHSTANCCVS